MLMPSKLTNTYIPLLFCNTFSFGYDLSLNAREGQAHDPLEK
jgi:hypothetical protein